ncbi:hypothetical protein [Novipirellula artificiosorum]|uniref:PEP-CTERM protein-sorting domain-containing protein n=1 Tax=Novipirellula artificiosorum TaxID=2528016 RepID=A0A5C6E1A7_9BACT|nr:hypothetical protein [Novipirellula artificiosorum]TWU41146.1 hypothetical protein Poly41_19840 [Novipirellula artificiosorum]
MFTFVRFACVATMFVATGGIANAAITLSFNPNPVLTGGSTTGAVDVQWVSTGSDTVGSISLDLMAINFTGAASSVTINSFTAAGGVVFTPFGPNTPNGTAIPPNPFTIAGFVTAPAVTTTPSTFGTFAFTLPSALSPGVDSFQFKFDDVPDPNPFLRGIVSTTGTQLYAGSGTGTVTAVPEPSSIAFCALLAVGAGGRVLRRRRNKKASALAC